MFSHTIGCNRYVWLKCVSSRFVFLAYIGSTPGNFNEDMYLIIHVTNWKSDNESYSELFLFSSITRWDGSTPQTRWTTVILTRWVLSTNCFSKLLQVVEYFDYITSFVKEQRRTVTKHWLLTVPIRRLARDGVTRDAWRVFLVNQCVTCRVSRYIGPPATVNSAAADDVVISGNRLWSHWGLVEWSVKKRQEMQGYRALTGQSLLFRCKGCFIWLLWEINIPS